MSDQSIPPIRIILLVYPDFASGCPFVSGICFGMGLADLYQIRIGSYSFHYPSSYPQAPEKKKEGVVVLLIIALFKLEMGSLGVTFLNSKCLIGSILSKWKE